MRIFKLFALVFVLAGCTSTGNMYNVSAPRVSYTAVDNSRMLYTGVDTEAINAAIRADDRIYMAPDDETLQQSMYGELSA